MIADGEVYYSRNSAGNSSIGNVMHPWQIYLFILAGWINREQQAAIEYLRAENKVLREHVGKRRILLSDDQRPDDNKQRPKLRSM